MKLSIVIPVYNSEKILDKLLKTIKNAILKKNYPFELLLINDCSSDKSWQKILQLKTKYKFIKAINLKYNYGQHGAIFCGLRYSTGDNIVCMDDDMQHDPIYITDMLDRLKIFEVCYVKFRKREHGYLKVLISKLNNIISSLLMNKSINIYTSSYKCFKKNIAKQIVKNNVKNFFLDYWIFKYSKKITFINVSHKKRYSGSTNYGFKEMLSLWSDMIFLIDTKKYSIRTLSIKIIRFFFEYFLNNYLNLKKKKNIIIKEKLL